MDPIILEGSIVRYGATRDRSGDKAKRITFEVFGPFDQLDELMDSPLKITIERGKDK